MHCYARPSPWLNCDDIAEAERRNSRSRFMRLFWGVWASSAGDALDESDLRAAVNPKPRPSLSRQPTGDFLIADLDLGIKHDHSALVIIAGSKKSLQLRLVCAQHWQPDPKTGRADLIAVEQAVSDAHQKLGLFAVGYDPYEAALMAQRLELRRVPMREMTFTGANLNLMASTLLEVFRSRRIELYDHRQLLDDLGRLSIKERAYGHRLTAVRNETGHADLATALAIALPFATTEVGRRPVIAGPIGVDTGISPYERALRDFQRRKESHYRERERLEELHDQHHQEGFREATHLLFPGRFAG